MPGTLGLCSLDFYQRSRRHLYMRWSRPHATPRCCMRGSVWRLVPMLRKRTKPAHAGLTSICDCHHWAIAHPTVCPPCAHRVPAVCSPFARRSLTVAWQARGIHQDDVVGVPGAAAQGPARVRRDGALGADQRHLFAERRERLGLQPAVRGRGDRRGPRGPHQRRRVRV